MTVILLNLYNEIRSALAALSAGDFAATASELLAALGYRSERTLPGQTGHVDDFSAQFPAANPDTQSEERFRQNVAAARILFQLTDSEIAPAHPQNFAAGAFDTDANKSFVFAAVELNGQSYARGQYAAFTREINKRLSQPTVVLFRSAADLLTLAFAHRRPHKRDKRRAVLGSVSLIREIDPASPQRAHLDILAELALAARLRWMEGRGERHNFDGLLAAWLDALDTEELNRRFYKDLFAWFTRALREARFPTNQAKTLPAEEHVIRLITRLLFVWFIREKGLIAADLFIEAQVGPLLRDYDRDSGDSYYRAVLQNLFFATLNTDIERRRFARKTNADHRNFSLYRYREEMAEPDALLALFAQTPFINGGLFDCLDSEEAPKQGGYRIDCFSDNANQRRGRPQGALLHIPNRLFFDDDGLIPLFRRYKFTVEENTPAEREVALDPELLGKVFENLLAAYTPETRASARKQTGSYYTPRPVVDYMVDEALVAALAEKAQPTDGDADSWRKRLRYLLDYEDAFNDVHELFAESEKESLVRAIAELKLLDPAVGSGAFPMGALHKLTLALRRLDPDNRRWEQLQKELARRRAASAFDRRDQRERAAELGEISDTFERYRDSDFGRKLYLIQNSVYGVDIQTIATQIAKLRFFISLAIEQEPTGEAGDNYGIKPLPNLETRFVAADTLLALGWTHRGQMRLGQTDAVNALQRELNANRERHFQAATRRKKLARRENDRRLRDRLAAALTQSGMPIDDAEKIARWDPYDQNAGADWFDAEYMFGVADGFDVVIGNPPYVVTKDSLLRAMYREGVYGRMNLYGLFIQRGLQLLSEEGQLSFIDPRTLLTDKYFMNLRKVIQRQSELKGIALIADRHNTFENVLQECIILHLSKKTNPAPSYVVSIRAISKPIDLTDSQTAHSIRSERVLLGDEYDNAFYIGASEFDYQVFEKMNAKGVNLSAFGLKAETGKLQFDKYRDYARPANVNDACRLVWAENIQRYARRESNRRIGKEWLAKSILSAVAPNITGVGIVTQRISANEQPRRIIATVVAPEYFYTENVYSENHTNFISLDDDSRGAFLLGALNSSLMEYLFRRLNSNTQLSAGEINSLPFPPMPDETTRDEIETLVARLLKLGGVDCQTEAVAQATADERRLDVLIGSLYGFSACEVERIQRLLPSYETVYGR